MSSVDSYDEKTRRRVDDNSIWCSWLRKTRRYILPCTCAVNDVDVQEQHEVSGKERSTTIPRETASAQIFGGITTTVTTTTTMSSINPEAMAEAARSWETNDDENVDEKKTFSDRRRRRWAKAGPVLRLSDNTATSSSDPTNSTASYGSHPTYSAASYGSNRSRSTYTSPPPPNPTPVTPSSSLTPTSSMTPSSSGSPITPSTASVSPRGSVPLLPADGHDDLQRWARSTSAALSWLSGSPEEQNVPARTRRRWGYVQQKG